MQAPLGSKMASRAPQIDKILLHTGKLTKCTVNGSVLTAKLCVAPLTACSIISLGPLLLRLCSRVSSWALVVITPRLSPSGDSTNTAHGRDCTQQTIHTADGRAAAAIGEESIHETVRAECTQWVFKEC
jgi:hypothetical protein